MILGIVALVLFVGAPLLGTLVNTETPLREKS